MKTFEQRIGAACVLAQQLDIDGVRHELQGMKVEFKNGGPIVQIPIIPLSRYIKDHHDGNQNAFAQANDVSRQLVRHWLQSGYCVSGDQLIVVKRKLVKKRV